MAACSTTTQPAGTGPRVASQPPRTTASTALTTTTALPPTTAAPTTTMASVDMGDLENWEMATILLGDEEMVVAIADDPGERAQGLMHVENLGDIDGMLFVFATEGLRSFWMKNTVLILDIAFFGGDRRLDEVLVMEPCSADPCPLYSPESSFRWAVEAPAGTLRGLAVGTTITPP